jgi:hypothetical protein
MTDGITGAAGPGRDAVLARFLTGGRIAQMPAKRSRRLLVLDHVARAFEPGRRYAERDVNVVLRAFFADYAALRRYLVDEGFLARDGGEYWRTGGSVDISSSDDESEEDPGT